MHYDGCDITCKWTVVMLEINYCTSMLELTTVCLIRNEGQAMLTRIDEYEGGGTYFRSLRKTVKLQQGQVLVHPGKSVLNTSRLLPYFTILRSTAALILILLPGELYHMVTSTPTCRVYSTESILSAHHFRFWSKGCDITYGVRCLLVCFTDGMNPKILDDSKSHEDHPSFRNNVVLY